MRLRSLRDALRADFNFNTERGRLIRSAGATAALKVGATLLAFGASLLYARVLGPHDYGLYAYVVAWVAVLTIPAGLGLPAYLVREGAKAPHSLHFLCRWGDKRVLISGMVIAVLMACGVFLPSAAGARWLFVIAAPLPLLNSLGDVRRSLLQARGWIARSQWPVVILGPMTMLAALAILWTWQGALHPVEVMAAMTGAGILPLLVNELQRRQVTCKTEAGEVASVRLGAALPFVWLGGLYLLNNRTDLILLGTLNGAHDAGVYSIAARAAELVTFLVAASNMVIAPRIASLHQKGQRTSLQRLVTAATRRTLALSAPMAIVLIAAARPIITYLYGPDYAEGAAALKILAGAQVLCVAIGPTGMLMNMTGQEKLAAVSAGLAAVVNITLNLALIPAYGIIGASIATALSLTAWNILLWYWIARRLALNPTVLGT